MGRLGPRRMDSVEVRLSAAEKANLDRVAAHYKRTASDIIRLLIEREAEWITRVQPSGQNPADPPG